MQTRNQVMCPHPPLWPAVSRSSARVARHVVRRGGVPGVAARQSAGCAGRDCGADRRGQERAA
jgi:hypothetical protein